MNCVESHLISSLDEFFPNNTFPVSAFIKIADSEESSRLMGSAKPNAADNKKQRMKNKRPR